MSASPVPAPTRVPTPVPAQPAETPKDDGAAAAKSTPQWQKYLTPILVVLLALALLITVTRNWNSWEGGKAEQVTDDAYVRGDLTPLSTKVAGIVRAVHVSDYQEVHKGDLLVELEDNDFQAQVDQANAAVEAARAAIEDNIRQRELQDARIAKALAGIDQAKAQIAAAQAGKEATQADLVRTRLERKRQEGLYQTHSTTQRRWKSRLLMRSVSRRSMPVAMPIWPKPEPCCAAMKWQPKPRDVRRLFWSPKECNYRRTCAPEKHL